MNSKANYSSNILAPISLGELIDKITILEIKQINMTGIKLKNIDKELKLLKNIMLFFLIMVLSSIYLGLCMQEIVV